jgi:atypical dual specificity phosphatase
MSFIFYDGFQVDAESSKELEQWNEVLKNDAVKLCQENNFNTGFFEGSENNSVIDAYELKVIFTSQYSKLKYIRLLWSFHL